MIRVPIRTVECWEQRRSTPSKSVTALILMAQMYPDTFDRLASLYTVRPDRLHQGSIKIRGVKVVDFDGQTIPAS